MIVNSNTPFRVSLFGGGTDFEEYFKKFGGVVIGGAINKYQNITLSKPLHKKSFILDFLQTKTYNNPVNIWHPVIKKNLLLEKIESLKISYSSDMLARSGIGSSSSFIIGYLNAINAFKKKKKFSYKKLIIDSYNFERNILKEYVGIQDHILCALGGFNIVKLKKGKEVDFSTKKISVNDKRIKFLNNNLLLYSTGQFRNASNIEKNKIRSFDKNLEVFKEIHNLSNTALKLFNDNKMDQFLRLIGAYWDLKKNLSKKVSNKKIDEMVDRGLESGALASKLIGAGGGGYVLFYCPKKKQNEFKKNFDSQYKNQDFKFAENGTRLF